VGAKKEDPRTVACVQFRSQDPPKGWIGRDVLAGNMGLLRLGPGGTKACLRAAGPRSRALETDASRL